MAGLIDPRATSTLVFDVKSRIPPDLTYFTSVRLAVTATDTNVISASLHSAGGEEGQALVVEAWQDGGGGGEGVRLPPPEVPPPPTITGGVPGAGAGGEA